MVSIVHGSVTYTITDAANIVGHGTFLDGAPYIKINGGTVSMTAKTPAYTQYFDGNASSWIGEWVTAQSRVVGDAVTVTSAYTRHVYRCEADHTTSASNKPEAGSAWTNSTAYVIGDIRRISRNANVAASDTYECTANHTSGASTQPGTGASWATVWKRIWRFGHAVNGLIKNPKYAVLSAGPTCDSLQALWDYASMATYPLSLAAGDCVLTCVSKSDLTNSESVVVRGGIATEWSWLHVIDYEPNDYEISPPPVWNTAHGARPRCIVNVDEWLTRIPQLSSAAIVTPGGEANFMAQFDRANVGYLNHGMVHNGYEAALPHQFGSASSNWGGYSVGCMNYALVALMSDLVSAANRRLVFIRLLQIGHHTYSAWSDYGSKIYSGDLGGHLQLFDAPMVLALHCAGRSVEIANIASIIDTNLLGQSKVVDQTYLDDMAAHNLTTKPYYSRRRQITNIDTGTKVITYTMASGSDTETSTYSLGLTNLYLQKEGSETQSKITTNDAAAKTITVSDTAGFAVDDIVYCVHPSGWTPAIGEFYWTADSVNKIRHSPSDRAAYLSAQYWSVPLMLMEAIGALDPIYAAADGFMRVCNASDSPLAALDYAPFYAYAGQPEGTAEGYYNEISGGAAVASRLFDGLFWADQQASVRGTAQTINRRGTAA